MSKIKEFVILKLLFPLADLIMGTCAMKWYRRIELMNAWDKVRIEKWQNEELHKFVTHAYHNTVYYKRLFDKIGLSPNDIRTKEDLKKIPIVDKEIINTYHDEFVPHNIEQFKYRASTTGGTTGEPLRYYCDENTWGYVTAAKIFYWKKTGYLYGDPFVALGSASLFSHKPSFARRIYDKLRNETALNSVNLTDEICAKYVKTIIRKKIKYLYGYAASIYIFTKYISKNKIDLSQIKAVFTTSENLTNEYRRFIERTYQCKVMDCYGAKDAGITAYEVKYHQYEVGYNVIAEITNQININTGSLLSTNFLNYSFPLIRYKLGDEICLQENSDEYNGQVITEILGRTSDVMRLANGHNLTATGFSMIMKEFSVVAFEIRKVSDLKVELLIQPISAEYTMEQEQKIRRTIVRYVGEDCELVINYVDKFEPLKNGKRRYFMN